MRNIHVHHVLILGCSQSKHADPDLLPAYLRYTGPRWQVLRSWLARGGRFGPDKLTVLCISGRYGLISADVAIRAYDQPLSPAFAAALRPAMAAFLPRLRPTGSVLICAGAAYRSVLPDVMPWPVHTASGGQGEQLRALKTWLDRTVGVWPVPAAPVRPRPRRRAA